jgi:AcrR family transcriptional regulator
MPTESSTESTGTEATGTEATGTEATGTEATGTEATGQRRQYNSEVRRQQAADTRKRILSAGTHLLNHTPTFNWPALTIRAVASEAGVNERTIYRYFGSERELRDAVMHHLEEKAGVDYEQLRLEDVVPVSRHLFEFVSSRPSRPHASLDPTVADALQRKRDGLLHAVETLTGDWTPADRTVAAAMLDLLWSVSSYQDVADNWDLEPEDVSRGIIWLIRLLEDAIRANRPPEP